MSPDFEACVTRAHELSLKIGPIAERPDRSWRVYVQKDTSIFRFAELPRLEDAFKLALDYAESEMTGEKPPAPKHNFLD